MDNQRSEKNRRGIDSIAHLFLSQLGKDNPQEIKRKPPVKDHGSEELLGSAELSSEVDGASGDEENAVIHNQPGESSVAPANSQLSENDDLKASLAGEIVLAYHLRDSYKKVWEYASYLSQRDERVALLSIDQYELTMITTLQSEGIGKAHVLAETECQASDLIPLINDAAEDYDMIILNVDPSFSGRVNEIISHGDCITIISDSTSDGIIRSYQVLKSVSDNILEDQEIQLFICDADSNEQADRAFYKFNETARKFVNKVIIPAGCTLRGESGERPIDDLGISEQEILELNLAEAGIVDMPEPETESKPLLDCEHYINSHDSSEISEIFARSEDSFVPDSYETISGDGVEYVNDSESEKVDVDSGFSSVESNPQKVVKSHYKPSSSGISDSVLSDGQEYQNNFDQKPYRLKVVSRSEEKCYNGPARVSPVRVYAELCDEASICGFICMNFGLLTGINGWLSTELRSFSERFANSRILIDQNGHIKILICSVYSEGIGEEIDSVSEWVSENIGVLTTRYRHLHIKSEVKAELVIVAGENYNAIYDQAIIASDELGHQCRILQLIRFELGVENYISLR